MDKRDYDIAAKLRLLAQDLHEGIIAARNAGLNVYWDTDLNEGMLGRKIIPGDKAFEHANLQISRTTHL